jgi:hypothetical protein
MTQLCYYCGSTYDLLGGHSCTPTRAASGTAGMTTVTLDRRLLTPAQPVTTYTASPSYLCPDLLRYEQIGAADGLRGRVVRAMFWVLRAWPPRR